MTIYVAMCKIETDSDSYYVQVKCDADTKILAMSHIRDRNWKDVLPAFTDKSIVRIPQIQTVEEIRDAGSPKKNRRRRRNG